MTTPEKPMPLPLNREWMTTFSLSGRIALVSIVFSSMLTVALLFAPSCAFLGTAALPKSCPLSGGTECGAYVFAVFSLADFMTWALVMVLVENLCSEAFSAFLELRGMDAAVTLQAYTIRGLSAQRMQAPSPAPAAAAAEPESVDLKQPSSDEVYSDASTTEAE